MGALHRGHRHLLERAAAHGLHRSPRVLLSVFVNPLQFAPGEDYARYPRDLGRDMELAAGAGAQACFAPSPEDLFPGGEEWLTGVRPPQALKSGLCGRSRPGHFDGVATVVCRLLALVRPDWLVLGEKDWQQVVILRRVLADLALPVRVLSCGTVRESDGLACSSRNRYLSVQERRQASCLPRVLRGAAERAAQAPIQAASLLSGVREELDRAGLEVDYVELVAPQTLAPDPRRGAPALLASAVRCGTTRLIDHVFVMSRAPIVAIDGPAGAGKSTVSRAFATRMGLIYLDTGAMYRAVTWWVRHQGVDPADPAAVAPLLEGLDLRIQQDPGLGQVVVINGHDVSGAIRDPAVTALVSTVAAHGSVREALTAQQQAMGKRGGLVAEGRDIGTAVFPDAECKIFLTATVEERARRRAEDLGGKGFEVPPIGELRDQIAERDHLDASRTVAPLRRAADAVELVTDGMAIEEVIEAMVDHFRQRVPEDAWAGAQGSD